MYREQAVEIIERHIDNNIASGSLVEQALSMAIDALKAQLSSEDATSDTISRTEVVEHLRRMLEATVPNTDYDEGFVDGVEFGVSTVSTMPIIQPQSTAGQLNDSARSTNLIDRQQAIDALWKALYEYEDKTEKQFQESEDLDIQDWIQHRIFVQNMNNIDRQTILKLPPAQPVATDTNVGDTISRQAAIDALDCISGVEEVLRSLPPAQPEREEGEWVLKDYLWECNKCGCRINVKNPLCDNNWNYYFCPHCGTKMTIAVQRF